MPKLEERIKSLEKVILQKNLPQEDKEKLLVEMEELKKILKESKCSVY